MSVRMIPPHAPFWTPELREIALSNIEAMRDAGVDLERMSGAARNYGAQLQKKNGRACGDCTLCCKLVGVKEIDKPQGHWCAHCDPRKGCAIYETRPDQCAGYLCLWAMGEGAPHMKPNETHCVLDYDFAFEGGLGAVRVSVDPQYEDAWTRGAVRDHIRLLHAMGVTVVVLLQNKERPAPAIGITGRGRKDAIVVEPSTGEPWVVCRAENLP